MRFRDRLTDRWMTTMSGAHRLLVKITGGRLGSSIGPMPVVELHTTGRLSGEPRSAMLTAPVVEDGRYILVASKGGGDRNPYWYGNLLAHPDVELTVGGRTIPMRARPATEAEKSALWPRVSAAFPGYARYRARTRRDIPLVICEPR